MCTASFMKKASSSRLVLLTVLMSALIVVGIANYVLVKVLFVAFKSGNGNSTQNATSAFFEMLTAKTNSSDDGSRYSFFVNQGINFFYIVVGGIMVYPRMCCTNDITPEMKKIPHKIFVIMALLDSFGTFFISMGAVYTPGQIQPLIQQALIPLTMVFSCIWLKERYNIWELVGAVLMLAGAAVSIVPTITGGTDGTSKWYACVIYFCSNIPMALSGVYKEMAFKKQPVDVWYLSQWVAIYQFLISFVFVPLLVVPFIGGTETGMSFADIWYSFRDGALCWVQLTPDCSGVNNKGQMWLLPVYTCVNMFYTALGLFVTKHGSAVLSRLANALILPLTAVAFALPFMGIFQESITLYTWIGLGVTLAGFILYQWAMEVYRKRLEAKKRAEQDLLIGDAEEGPNSQMLQDPLMDGE